MYRNLILRFIIRGLIPRNRGRSLLGGDRGGGWWTLEVEGGIDWSGSSNVMEGGEMKMDLVGRE